MPDQSRAAIDRDPDVGLDIVVVPRERYSSTLASLRALVATVPDDVRIIVVRGGMPARTVRALTSLDRSIEVIGPARHLAPNAARQIGLRACTRRFVIFVDNDIVPAPGWIDPLLHTARTRSAWVVRPVVLQQFGEQVTVHDAGGDCHLERHGSVTTLVETHRFLGRPTADLASLHEEPVELFEFHAVLFDRERLVALGGPDERMSSIGDHLDLALRVHRAGGEVWFQPASVVSYPIPERLAVTDLAFFLGRWSRGWNLASRRVFRETHGVDDPADPYETWKFGDLHRSLAWLPLGRPVARLVRRPIARGVAKRFDRVAGRHLAELVVRVAPRWRGGGREYPT